MIVVRDAGCPRPRRRLSQWAGPVLGLVAVAALGLGASGCSGSSSGGGELAAPSSAELERQLTALADDVVVPAYDAFGEATSAAKVAASALCAEPNEANLTAARDAWREAVLAWQGTRAFGLGPAMEARLMSDVAFAARASNIEDLLADDAEPVDTGSLADRGAAVRGLYALEVALFGEGSDSLAAAGARRCEYAASVATLVDDAVAPVVAAWADGDAAEQFAAGLDGGPQSTVALLVNDAIARLEELEGRHLRDLAEADGPDDLDEDRLDGPAAYRLADRKALADSVIALLGDDETGLIAIVDGYSPELADRLAEATARAEDAMAALPDSVAEAFADPDAVAEATDAIGDLKVLLSTEVASALGVTITFSDSDGDS